jgi:nicotinamidase-related amidase
MTVNPVTQRAPLGQRDIPASAADLTDPATTALLLWDLQVGLGGHALEVDELLPRWVALRDAARAAGVLIVRSRHIAIPHEEMPDTELWRLMRKQRVASPTDLAPYMQPDTDDVRFLPGLEPGPGELVIDKTTPSLFVGTNAQTKLTRAGIRSIVMAGVATDIGIDFTARHALALGFFPVVLEDAVGAYTDAAQQRGLASIRAFAPTSDTSLVRQAWAAAAPTSEADKR